MTDAAGDHSLVAAAIRGDVDAVRRVWQDHRRWVAAVLLAHKPAGAEVDDLLQDVAMAYVRTIGKLRDESALKPWLRTVAINAARAAGRQVRLRQKQQVVLAAQGAMERDQPPPSDAEATDRDESGHILRLIQEIPEGYREPLILRCVRGMNYRQIGELLSLPETTIETRIARGRRMLRDLVSRAASPLARIGAEPRAGGLP
ncbi:MAG: RNA polymerase sigma factor [Phycisphaerales bacterium]|nr:RNA polymerase sigma factor [Phycisphaerales bacterium]